MGCLSDFYFTFSVCSSKLVKLQGPIIFNSVCFQNSKDPIIIKNDCFPMRLVLFYLIVAMYWKNFFSYVCTKHVFTNYTKYLAELDIRAGSSEINFSRKQSCRFGGVLL